MSQELKIQEPERQQWGSRLGFILASIGSAIGLGNMLRYPSVVWANNGAQWFIPYLIALFFIGIPLLLLEIAMGQTYRSGNYVSFGRINDRLRGLGAGTNINAFIVATYYQIIIAWVLVYFGYSFSSGALPWAENPADFFDNVVLRNVPVDKGNWDIVWTSVFLGAVVWFFVFLCLFKGVDSVGKVVYFTTGFPCIILIVLVIRGVTLENAGRGIHFYTGVWNMEQLYTPQIWQAAIGQIFFSIGAGFGTYTTYSSYNPKEQNAVQDCLIVGISNSLFEIIAGFAAFGIAGFLNLDPAKDKLSTFSLGFLTYPTALAQLPGAQIWCILFFFTLFLLGIDSAFALIEGLITMIEDSAKFQKVSRVAICSSVCFVGALCGLIYASDIGLSFLDKVDLYTNCKLY